MKNTKFTLLQYNVQKSQSVQELLLATPTLQEVDIIALQEPWKNPHLQTSTSTVFSSFLPLYSPEIGRTLFLINKNLNLSSLHPTFWSKDFVSLEIHCCGLYCTVLSEYRIRARGGRRVGSRRRGVSRSAKGFGGTW